MVWASGSRTSGVGNGPWSQRTRVRVTSKSVRSTSVAAALGRLAPVMTVSTAGDPATRSTLTTLRSVSAPMKPTDTSGEPSGRPAHRPPRRAPWFDEPVVDDGDVEVVVRASG